MLKISEGSDDESLNMEAYKRASLGIFDALRDTWDEAGVSLSDKERLAQVLEAVNKHGMLPADAIKLLDLFY